MTAPRRARLRPGEVVTPLHFVPGYPTGACVDVRYVVREITKGRAGVGERARMERDDGRDGSWWVDTDSLRRWGQS